MHVPFLYSWHVIIRLCYLVQSHQAAQPPALPARHMMQDGAGRLGRCVRRFGFWQVLHETQYNPPYSKTCLENERKKNCEWALEKDENPVFLSSPSSHQCIALIIMGQKRLPQSLGDVRVWSAALELVEWKLITAVIKPVIALFERWGRCCRDWGWSGVFLHRLRQVPPLLNSQSRINIRGSVSKLITYDKMQDLFMSHGGITQQECGLTSDSSNSDESCSTTSTGGVGWRSYEFSPEYSSMIGSGSS